jgi:WhiB family redox-sensing transcriptional regulator
MWQDSAACRGADPELFFPRSENMATVRQVKRFCDACPVRTDCLADALENGHHGIWAATTTAVRSRMVNRGEAKRRPAPRSTAGAEERRERYAELRAGGFTIHEAAWELGVAYETALRYDRLQREGQPA